MSTLVDIFLVSMVAWNHKTKNNAIGINLLRINQTQT